jgi:hypothetical protein
MNDAVMFTALPNGIVSADGSGTYVSLTIYVTPRLASPSLASVPAFADWPSVAAGLTFSVQVNNEAVRPVATLDPSAKYAANRFDSDLWKAIFWPAGPRSAVARAVPVTPWAARPSYAKSGLLSFGSKDVSTTVKTAYQSVATSTKKPTIGAHTTDALSTRTRDIASVLHKGKALGQSVKNAIGQTDPATGRIRTSLSLDALNTLKTTGALPALTHAETPEFVRVAAYHNRDNDRDLTPSPAGGPRTIDQPDFHQIIGHLADHPAILRRLGLIIDVIFKLPNTADGFASIFVVPSPAIAGLDFNHPWTYCVVHPAVDSAPPAFRPFYGDAEVSPGYPDKRLMHPLIDTNGLLRAEDKVILHLDDLDIDHAATHLAHHSEKTISDLNAQMSAGGPATLDVTLPALRTAGFSLNHLHREGQIGLRFQDTVAWNPDGSTFVAEDFVRGYRVDVRTPGGPWQSLCLRQTTFSFTNGFPAFTVDAPDEGYIKASAMTSSSDDAVHNVTESLFHWDGWSLVASRPGKSVGALTPASSDPKAPRPQDGAVLPVNAGDALNLPFTTTIKPQPGKLPKLRFGTSYQFRVRAVNLAGNDMILAAAGNAREHASPVNRFERYEPVSPPAIHLRRAVTEGESVEHLVIRSDPYAKTPVYAAEWAAKNNVAPPGPPLPPDAPISMGMNLFYATCERHVAPPKTSVQLAEFHGAFDQAVANLPPAARAKAAWAIASKEEGGFFDTKVTDSTTGLYQTYTQPGRYIVTPPSSKLDMKLAIQANEPVFTGTDEITPRGTALLPGQYVIFDADSVMTPYLPDFNATGVALQGLGGPVFRPFGARASNPSGGAWPELNTFRIVLTESRGDPTISGFTVSPTDTAPSVPLAVALPPATVLELTYSSTLNDSTIQAFGPASSSDPSYASAQSGLLPAIAPSRSLTFVHAVQRPQLPTPLDGDITLLPRTEGQTAHTVAATLRFHGASSGRVDLVASWDEYVDLPSDDSAIDPSKTPIRHSGAIFTTTPDPTDSTQFTQVRQLFGDTKRRDIQFSTVATTRFREYFPSSITSNAANITNTALLPGAPLVCMSSARPPIPKVLYAVPSFIFTPDVTPTARGGAASRTRSGGTVRVYVDRGWFASGTDERLGVVLARNAAEMKAMPNLVSVWGPDPIWYRGQLGPLDTSHVSAATVAEVFHDVPLAEGTGFVHVATFTPNFNKERKLWYFDIELSPDQAYFPFLRLALVRYQPKSVGTLHMSRVVCTEFVQLSADRTSTVVDLGGGNYNVTVVGPTAPNLKFPNATAVQLASGHTVTAEFQQATTASPDPVDWTTIGSVTTLSPTSFNGVTVSYTAPMAFSSVPADQIIAGAKHRILFREYEVFAADNQPGVSQGVGIVQINQPATAYTTRIVYVDAVAIGV